MKKQQRPLTEAEKILVDAEVKLYKAIKDVVAEVPVAESIGRETWRGISRDIASFLDSVERLKPGGGSKDDQI